MTKRFFDHDPKEWQQLEDMVYSAFVEMGYETYRNHSVKTVRGNVDIDVYAIDNRSSIPTIIICECKYWKKPVNQQIIHGFRSICTDIGAHYALVISKVGFQSGALETREFTNVHLLDFTQFQEKYFEQWRLSVFVGLSIFGNKIFHPVVNDKYDHETYTILSKKYSLFRDDLRRLMDYKFPIQSVDPRGDLQNMDEITINSPREYFEIAKEAYEELVSRNTH